MNRSDSSFSVIDSVDTGASTDRVQKTILVSVQGRRSNDRGFRERLPHSDLSLVFGAVEGGLGIGGCVEMGKMNESRYAGKVGDSSDSTGAGDVDVVEGEVSAIALSVSGTAKREEDVLGFVVSTDEIVDGVGVSQTFLDLSIVVEIPFLWGSVS